jgi:hypothetical protein
MSAGGAPNSTSTGSIADGVGGGISTDCSNVTPVDGEACDSEGTVCGLDEGDEVCACFDTGEGAVWSCFTGAADAATTDFGGLGGGFGTGNTGM